VRKSPVPKRGIYIIRLGREEVLHVYINGEHDCFLCGRNYIQIKKGVKAMHPRANIKFIQFS